MQETAKGNYVQYGKGTRKTKPKPRPSGGSGSGGGGGSSVNARKPSKLTGKGRKIPLPTDYLLEMWKIKTSERSTL